VNARQTAGDSRVYYVDTTGWLGNGDFTDGTHPNEQGSQKAATALVAAMKSIGFP
jgi:lysophospholipase L1-like esterase